MQPDEYAQSRSFEWAGRRKLQAPEIGVVVSGYVDDPDRARPGQHASKSFLEANSCQSFLRSNAGRALRRRRTRGVAGGLLLVAFASRIPIDVVFFFYSRHSH